MCNDISGLVLRPTDGGDPQVEQLIAKESHEIHPIEQILVSIQAIGAMIEAGQRREIQDTITITKALRDLTDAMTAMSDNQNKMIAILLKGLEND